MPTTYRCLSCGATWKSDRAPTDCSQCGSRQLQQAMEAPSPFDDPYGAPQAALVASRPVSSTSFSIMYWLGLVGILIGIGLISASGQNEPSIPGTLIAFVGMILITIAGITALVKIYRAWVLIQPLRQVDPSEYNMPSPGLAIGLLFVPLFGLYWNFVAFYGLATRANKYLAFSRSKAQPMNAGLAQAYCIMTACAIIPCVGVLLAVVNVFLFYFFILDVDRFRGSFTLSEVDF